MFQFTDGWETGWILMAKNTTARRGRMHKARGDDDLERQYDDPWAGDSMDNDPRGDLRDSYEEPDDHGSDDYDWPSEEREDDD